MVPLTLLIWVYAEREQVKTETVMIPVQVVSTDPNRVVTLDDPKKSQTTITATVSGPKAKLDQVRERLDDRSSNGPLRIEVGPNVGVGRQRVSAVRLSDDPLFAANGVTVTSPQPESIEVYVDPVVERNVPVKPQPGFTSLQPPKFDPPTVKVRGPARVLDEAATSLVAFASLNDRPELAGLGSGENARVELKDVQLTLSVRDPNVAIVGKPSVTATAERVPLSEWTYEYVPVLVTAPFGLSDEFKVELKETTVKNVTVIGPKEKVDRLKELLKRTSPPPPQPKAVFEIPPDAPAGPGTATIKYDLGDLEKELGPGLSIKPGGAPQTIEYTLTRR